MRILIRKAEFNGRILDYIVDDGLICAVGRFLPEAGVDERIDAQGALIAPAFMDLQVNGAFGHDFVRSPESLWLVAEKLTAQGVGYFLPTIITSAPEATEAMLEVLRAGPPPGFLGAEVLGLHLEGPHLAQSRQGAHEACHLRRAGSPLPSLFDPLVKMVTLAPEIEGASELIAALSAQDIIVSAGHSDASYDEVTRAIGQGLRTGTHLFNAMSGLHHRSPGLAAALLDCEALSCGLIADGIHVAESMLRLAWKLKGPERLYLVSDAMAAAGCPEGRYELAGQTVEVCEGAVRLPDGSLAGSAALLDHSLRIMMKATSATLAETLPLVTTTPASLLNRDIAIRPGSPANLVLLSQDGQVNLTLITGQIAFRQ